LEEGLIRSITVDAVNYNRGQLQPVYPQLNVQCDQTLSRKTGIGRLNNQPLPRLSLADIRGTSWTTLLGLHRRF